MFKLVAGGIDFLVGIEHAGDQSDRLFLVQQSGKILIYDGRRADCDTGPRPIDVCRLDRRRGLRRRYSDSFGRPPLQQWDVLPLPTPIPRSRPGDPIKAFVTLE